MGLLLVGAQALPAPGDALVFAPGRAPFTATTQPRWVSVPKTGGRLHAADLGLVINTADPYSTAVGEYYMQARALKPYQVLRLALPVKPVLDRAEFDALQRQIEARFGRRTQALALAWVEPYAVQCNSITAALTLGFDPSICAHSCDPARASPYANSASVRPYDDLGMRLSMLLAARDIETAKRLIDRGVAADATLGWHGAPPAKVYFLSTADARRNVRQRLDPPDGWLSGPNVLVQREALTEYPQATDVLLLQTGVSRLPPLDGVHWLNGALADHLTSYGGQLAGSGSQSSALEWIDAGATASYGTVSEPCNHPQKFPNPQWLLLYYLQGSTAIEAYWKSVLWPQQGLFIGEPLAAPFARR